VRLQLREQAKSDLVSSARYYNDERSGLGDRLVDAVERSLSLIEAFPEAAPVVYGNVRRIRTRRFPFAIFYLVSRGRIEVLRILHLARDPGTWPRLEG